MKSPKLLSPRCLSLSAGLAALLALSPAAAWAETVLVAAGTPMTWKANSSDPGLGTSWTAEAFTPSGWNAGTYGVGYETGTGAAALLSTTVPSTSNSVYTRTTFSVADVSAVTNLFLGADYDDGYVAWINGVEVFRSGQMPAGAPSWNSPAALHESSNGASPNYNPLEDISAAALGAIHNGTNVLAVGVWNSTLPSSDLVLVPRLAMNLAGAVTRGPYLQLGTDSSVVVRWRTTTAGDSCVRYGAAPASLTSIACAGASTTEHVVSVTGLDADTRYYYSVGTSAATLAGGTADYSFATSPPPGVSRATRVWVLGDSGTADTNARAVRDAYYGFAGGGATDLWLMLGDNAYNSGTDSEFQAAVFNIYPEMLRQSVLWPTLGNHDGASADSLTQSGPYYDIFTLPAAGEAGGLASGTEAYYSFDYGDIHFICLDSYETSRSAGGAMMNWLAADLADTTARWTVAFFHHPPYSKGSHNSDTETAMVQMRENALPLLEQAGVDLVLSGHSHSYERSFLLDGHYDVSSTLTAPMLKDAGSGREGDTGAYEKTGGGPVPNEGAVYVVAGSSGKISSATLNHPAMYISLLRLGSMVLDINGDRLDAVFLDETGAERDWFTLVKNSPGATCGNGILEAGEDCDDGNAINTDACRNDCTLPFCGDGILDGGEQCDGAALGSASCGGCAGAPACTASCTIDLSACTDGICTGSETCGSCAADCTGGGATCGNGLCEAGDGENCLTCPADCNGRQGGKPNARFCCGAPGGSNNVGCSASQCGSCTTASASSCCGDGLCGGSEDGTSCSRDCGAAPFCGDGACNGAETPCSCAGDCGAPPASETSCNDGVDNDCDGLTDCSDTAQCSASPSCATCSGAGATCTSNATCCSGKCTGKAGAKTCR
ncbi:MAG: metallophosphoesterase [Candidatus Binatia bacterium]